MAAIVTPKWSSISDGGSSCLTQFQPPSSRCKSQIRSKALRVRGRSFLSRGRVVLGEHGRRHHCFGHAKRRSFAGAEFLPGQLGGELFQGLARLAMRRGHRARSPAGRPDTQRCRGRQNNSSRAHARRHPNTPSPWTTKAAPGRALWPGPASRRSALLPGRRSGTAWGATPPRPWRQPPTMVQETQRDRKELTIALQGLRLIYLHLSITPRWFTVKELRDFVPTREGRGMSSDSTPSCVIQGIAGPERPALLPRGCLPAILELRRFRTFP